MYLDNINYHSRYWCCHENGIYRYANVGADGKISKVWILKSEPQHLFDSAVIAAMAQWRYETNKPGQGLTKTIYFKLQAPSE
ncbi:TPA: TonB family protein [Klebsiella pneumoniae]|nr:TonB family protein [Klebsiella pneumoniae]